jgi:hypothetical protein
MKTSFSKQTGRNSLLENEVVRQVTDFLISEDYRVRHEVPNMGQSADIVATRGNWVTFVEAKVRDWRCALRQCVAHEQVADFICVAVATVSASKALVAEIETCGYGLILCCPSKGHCEWVMPPRRNGKIWRPQRQRLVSLMRKIEYAY